MPGVMAKGNGAYGAVSLFARSMSPTAALVSDGFWCVDSSWSASTDRRLSTRRTLPRLDPVPTASGTRDPAIGNLKALPRFNDGASARSLNPLAGRDQFNTALAVMGNAGKPGTPG
jgi:hypothetical protein